MTTVNLKGNPFRIVGDLPAVGSAAPDFRATRLDLSEATLATYAGKKKVLNIFPSIDTPVCAQSVRTFHAKAAAAEGTVVLAISADLPFAFKRFCAAEGLEGVEALSTFRGDFASAYGVRLEEGPLAGLCARAVLVLDADNRVLHSELVPEIAQEPDYAAALEALA